MNTWESLKYLSMGAVLGLTAGISPGPLLTLVITQTLKYNRREGIKIAISPLLTDLPIVAITFYVFSKLSSYNFILGLISLLGAIFIAYLGRETLRVKTIDSVEKSPGVESLKRGVVANFLSPHPYLFWLTVGAPLAVEASQLSISTAVLFFLAFYLMLIGSKSMVAFLVAGSKSFLKNNIYKKIMQILGIILFVFAIIFLYEGINYFL